MKFYELNIDGLVGPTHHYAGLSSGNIASVSHRGQISNPQEAALQGIKKMRLLHALGLPQAISPPHQRPNLALLQHLGFKGVLSEQLQQAYQLAPDLLSACFSASSMWTANMGTTAPSLDTDDARVHFTAANLTYHIHRSQEADFSSQLLQKIFSNEQYFAHHSPLPQTNTLSDEGAANHSRLCQNHGGSGLHLFVYGKRTLPANQQFIQPTRFPARQTLEASQTIARLHGLNPASCFFIQQNPAAIDQGVFHNDVIAVANESVLLLHEDAFLEQKNILQSLNHQANFFLQFIEIKRSLISLEDAVKSYLFNSQLITLPNGEMMLIAPHECEENPSIYALIQDLIQDQTNPIYHVHYFNLKQSMQNGGGPACLRFRVVLSEQELQAMHQGILVNNELLTKLEIWVKKHYRTELYTQDLLDPSFTQDCFYALDELTQLLDLGYIYPFQLKG